MLKHHTTQHSLKFGLYDKLTIQSVCSVRLQSLPFQLLHTRSNIWSTTSGRYRSGVPLVVPLIRVLCRCSMDLYIKLLVCVDYKFEDSISWISSYGSPSGFCFEVWIRRALSQGKRRSCIDKEAWYCLAIVIWKLAKMACLGKIIVRLRLSYNKHETQNNKWQKSWGEVWRSKIKSKTIHKTRIQSHYHHAFECAWLYPKCIQASM
jgi:hypothetical protein